MKAFQLVLIFNLLFSLNLYSDSPLPPYTYISTSENGKYYFKMYADTTDYSWENGYGYAYIIGERYETDSLLWETNGWYSYDVYLSNDGHYLVQTGIWPQSPLDKSDLAIAFYKDGQLLKSYSTVDLIQDTNKVEYTVSHYNYSIWEKNYPYKNEYQIITTDNLLYTFNITNGEIISTEVASWFDVKLLSITNGHTKFYICLCFNIWNFWWLSNMFCF